MKASRSATYGAERTREVSIDHRVDETTGDSRDTELKFYFDHLFTVEILADRRMKTIASVFVDIDVCICGSKRN